jgi:hypothetical protein
MKSALRILLLSLLWCALILSLGVFSGYVTISVSAPWLLNPLAFVYRHLRLSIVPFGFLFLLYGFLIGRMRLTLQRKETKLSDLTFYDRLLNTTVSTFFGVGVIWTAIGMERALMQALEGVQQGQEAVVALSATGLLERVVNGGLLLALSTTIFGGVCGYLLRLLKILLLGKDWDRFVLQEAGDHV